MPTDKEQEMINKKIEKLIADDKKKDLSLKKLLLLGKTLETIRFPFFHTTFMRYRR